MDSQVSISRLCFLFCLYLSLVTAALHVDNPDKVHVPVNNYYLYQLVKTVDPLAEKNIESMIREIFNQNGITFEKVHTDPLMKTLTFKVKFLCHKVKKCKGGRQLKKLLAKLKSSTYDLKFTYKTDTPRKRKLQEDFAEERKRRKLLEDELETANTVVKDLVKATSILQSELGTDGNKKRSRGKTKDKRKYSACQKRRHKKKEINRAKNVVEALRPNGMSPVLIIFKDEHSKEVQLSFENREGKGRCETDRAVYLIDKFNISRRAYHELAQSCDSLPTQNLVSNRIKDLNAQFNVQAVSGSFTGVYQSIEERLTVKLRQMSASKQDEDILQDGRIKVKISGDGTRIGKRIHV
ncbi:hypothetical protein BSL78_15486 [Apostichopus japonicus]|uniref:Uncharacterized protein n=1 Tax=Stichopus japonicus TaxID=307972 RepID=A0A2G8KI37_STIJA|nr:hypothetical protein BSL78_15486 [Apostichopus japonicus]